MRSRPSTVQLANGIVISYVERGDPEGPPVLLVPGLGDSWRSYEPVIDSLPAQIHAFAMSCRGHGDSSRPDDGYRFADFVRDLELFMEALEIGAAVLAGHSSHGMVAESFALEHPEGVTGLVLIATPLTLRGSPAARDFFRSTLSHLTDPLDAGFIRRFAESTLARPLPTRFLDTLLEETAKVPARVFIRFFEDLMTVDLSVRLTEVSVPALLVWGERDEIVSRSEQEKLAATLPKSRVAVYPGSGHSPHWEEPERFAADLGSFVAGL